MHSFLWQGKYINDAAAIPAAKATLLQPRSEVYQNGAFLLVTLLTNR